MEQCIARVAAAEGFTVTESGVRALVAIGHGDMRRVLNVLQSTWMARQQQGGSAEIDSEAVYDSTGHPKPEDIRTILTAFLSESLARSIAHVREIQIAKGLALQDMLTELLPFVLRLECDQVEKMRIVDKLAEIECRVAAGSSEKLQLSAIAAAFQHLRTVVSPSAADAQ